MNINIIFEHGLCVSCIFIICCLELNGTANDVLYGISLLCIPVTPVVVDSFNDGFVDVELIMIEELVILKLLLLVVMKFDETELLLVRLGVPFVDRDLLVVELVLLEVVEGF